MKQTILTLSILLMLFSAHAQQFFPGLFYRSVGNSYDTIGRSPCIVDSSFYVIRYGGVQSISSDTSHSLHYLWNRFYDASFIRKGPGATLILLRANKIYQYFPAQDSMVCISGSIPSPAIQDICASESSIWAVTNFNQIGQYDSTGWHIVSLPHSYNPIHILALNDSVVYLGDLTSVCVYSPSGLSQPVLQTTANYDLHDWSIDTALNVWMSLDNALVRITPAGVSTRFDYTNVGFMNSGEAFRHVAADNAGNIWTCTDYGRLCKYDGHIWTTPASNFPTPISAIGGDRFSDRVFVLGVDSVMIFTAGSQHKFSFLNMPYQNIRAIATGQIATDQGIFTYNTTSYPPRLVPAYFADTSTTPYANEVTCFLVNDLSTSGGSTQGFGTHHGVYQTTVTIDNSLLPDSNINFLYYTGGSYYIGTDKGLCVYNQVMYSTFDTSNSGLPSNKITYIVSYPSPYTQQQELWVGTDQGLALYTGGHWTRFDTSIIHTSDLYVSGILPCPAYYMNRDSTVWVSTLGSGLLKLHRDGRYTLYNTANGNFADDTIFYVAQRIGCGYPGDIVMGTASNGICYYISYGDSFSHNTVGSGYGYNQYITYHNSRLLAQSYQSYFNNQTVATTDQGLYFLAGNCVVEGITGINSPEIGLKWHQLDDEKLWVDISDIKNVPQSLDLYDLTGHRIIPTLTDIRLEQKQVIDIRGISPGIYILTAQSGSDTYKTKVSIIK